MGECWFSEKNTEGYEVKWKINKILHSEKTPYQKLLVIDTWQWGKALILDDALQVSEKDEFIYHEMIVHVAMCSHPGPKNVLIIGGGDGGTLREACKHECLERVDMVEIDARVVENSKKYLPTIAVSFDDPRLNLYFADGIEYVKKPPQKYDLVIVDSSDPIGPAQQLFTRGFYNDIYNCLNHDGMMVVQSESPLFYQDVFTSIYRNISSIFPITKVYQAFIPTYVSGPWSFTIGSKRYDPSKAKDDNIIPNDLKYYNRKIHASAFTLPIFIKNMLCNNPR
ncbi:MAG: polyamine aminopropyltransferase [Syntrophomonadaceae bacterium]